MVDWCISFSSMAPRDFSEDILLHLHFSIIFIWSSLVDNLCKEGQEIIGLEEMHDNGIIHIMKANKHGSASLPSHHHVTLYTTFWVYILLLSTYHHEGILDITLLKVNKDFIH